MHILHDHWLRRFDPQERTNANRGDVMKTGHLGRGVLVFIANDRRCGIPNQWRTLEDSQL